MLRTKSSVWTLLLLTLQVAALVITRVPEQDALISTPATATLSDVIPESKTQLSSLATDIAASPVVKPISVVTPAPSPSGAALEKRQPCCFNEQGFRVDCDTWTGYYYTWGPSGNPYEGGPQCDGNWNGDGSGSGSGSGSGGSGDQGGGTGVAPYDNLAVDWHQPTHFLAAGVVFLVVALML